MNNLSAKVFRTYNASVTLERLDNNGKAIRYSFIMKFFKRVLQKKNTKIFEKLKNEDFQREFYENANKKVAVLCNHQRSIQEAHNELISRINIHNEITTHEAGELNKEKNVYREVSNVLLMKDTRILFDGKTNKESNDDDAIKNSKTVALGTSKINYMDPRITISWCKRFNIPVENIFNRSLISKFGWAMKTTQSFIF